MILLIKYRIIFWFKNKNRYKILWNDTNSYNDNTERSNIQPYEAILIVWAWVIVWFLKIWNYMYVCDGRILKNAGNKKCNNMEGEVTDSWRMDTDKRMKRGWTVARCRCKSALMLMIEGGKQQSGQRCSSLVLTYSFLCRATVHNGW